MVYAATACLLARHTGGRAGLWNLAATIGVPRKIPLRQARNRIYLASDDHGNNGPEPWTVISGGSTGYTIM
jgi:hypothetical protein